MKQTLIKIAKHARRVGNEAPLSVALGIVLIITLLLTFISVGIYYASGTSRLDLSRPGFEQERAEVRTGNSAKVYDTTSPVTPEAVDEFLREFDDRTHELNQYGDFRDQALDDASLQITEDAHSGAMNL